MWSRLSSIITYLTIISSYVSCISTNGQFGGSGKECGSFAAVKQLLGASDRIVDNASPLKDNGGMASLHNSATDLRSSTLKCGASLITDRYLLTAAHCMVNSNRPISISLGREDLDRNPSPSDIYRIQNVIIHPEYKSETNEKHDYNDIALLETDRKVVFKENIWPFCLPENKNQVLPDYTLLQIAGWGHVNISHRASIMQTAYIKIISNSLCETEWLQYAPHHYDNLLKFSYPDGLITKLLCAGRKGVDACNGDSGGPMTYQNSDSSYTVIGVIAKGIPCAQFPTLPGFYSNIALYLDWIYANIGQQVPPAHTNIPQTTVTTPLPRPAVTLSSRKPNIPTLQTNAPRPAVTLPSRQPNIPTLQTNAPGLLSLPDPQLCSSRPKQWNFGGHNYFFSWDQSDIGLEVDPITGEIKEKKMDWLEARNQCRIRCMDAVGMETEAENNMISDFMKTHNITYTWTSGRICDFKGCSERADLQPVNIYGWFWSNTNTKLAPTNSTPWSAQPWSPAGHYGGPQPDNAEYDINQTSESCLGFFNNIYKDGIKWHDVACYHKKPFICEDNDILLKYVAQTNPGINL